MEVAKKMKAFFEVTYGLSGDTLNLGLDQEMEGKAVHTRQEHHV